MRKTIVVAVREYQAAVRTKAFIITLVAMPILMGGSIAAQAFLKDKGDIRDRKLAVVDHSGLLFDGLAAAARERNTTSVFIESGERRRQTQPRFLLEKIEPASDDRDQVLYDLSERVRSNEFFAFAIISAEVLDSGRQDHAPSVDYHSNSPTYRDLRRWLAGTLNQEIQQRRFQRVGLDPAVVKSATRPVPIQAHGLVSRDESGQITKAEKTNDVASFVVPAGLMMLMFMVVMVGASPLVNSVLEEKMQRIAVRC